MQNYYKKQQKLHDPVLKHEVLEAFGISEGAHLKNSKFIDATLGLGGHAREIVKRGGALLGIDADKNSLEAANRVLEEAFLRFKTTVRQACPASDHTHPKPYILAHGNFKDIKKIAKENDFGKVVGILMDLGLSSPQIISDTRGFSFQEKSSKLDMRLDQENQAVIAADLLNVLGKSQITEMFSVVLPVPVSRKLAQQIIQARKKKKFETVGDFLRITEKIRLRKSKTNPATLPFMALRIAVNDELNNLKSALPQAFDLLVSGGRLVVISFHSGEDKIVKEFIKKVTNEGAADAVSKKPVIPSNTEIERNKRARSAKMRVVEKK